MNLRSLTLQCCWTSFHSLYSLPLQPVSEAAQRTERGQRQISPLTTSAPHPAPHASLQAPRELCRSNANLGVKVSLEERDQEVHLQSKVDGKQTCYLEVPKWELSLRTLLVTMVTTN